MVGEKQKVLRLRRQMSSLWNDTKQLTAILTQKKISLMIAGV